MTALIIIGQWLLVHTAVATVRQPISKTARVIVTLLMTLLGILGFNSTVKAQSSIYQSYYANPAHLKCAKVTGYDWQITSPCFDEVAFNKLWSPPIRNYAIVTDDYRLFWPVTGQVTTHDTIYPISVAFKPVERRLPTPMSPHIKDCARNSTPFTLIVDGQRVVIDPRKYPLIRVANIATFVIGDVPTLLLDSGIHVSSLWGLSPAKLQQEILDYYEE